MFDDFHPGLVAGLVGAVISILLNYIFHVIYVFHERHQLVTAMRFLDYKLQPLLEGMAANEQIMNEQMMKYVPILMWAKVNGEAKSITLSWNNVSNLLKLNEIINSPSLAQLVTAEAAAQAAKAAKAAAAVVNGRLHTPTPPGKAMGVGPFHIVQIGEEEVDRKKRRKEEREMNKIVPKKEEPKEEKKEAPYEKECKNLLSSSEDPLHTISPSHQEEIHPQGLPRRRRRGGDIREHGHGNEADASAHTHFP